MPAAGYTPVSLYYSTTGAAVPVNTNLVNGELAINITDGKLYYKDNSGTVQLIASKAGASGDVTLAGNNAFTGANTFYNGTGQTFGTATAAQDGIIIKGRAGGTGTYRVSFVPTTLSASRTATFPDADTTIPVATQVLTFSGPTAARTITLPDASFTAARTDAGQTFTGSQTVQAASTQDAVVIAGRAGGTSSYAVTLTPSTLSASRTATLPDGGANYTLGYLNIPAIADKTASYTIATADVGKVVGVGTGGSITIPNSTFAAGDAVLVFNNTSAGITITCNTTTAYIAGTDASKASVTLATRGVANILFISATACVITGNVS